MDKHTNQMMLFKEFFGKKVAVDFNGGEVSSDAGLLFLRETEAQIGIINRVANAIHDQRHPSYIKHHIVHLLTQRVFQIAAGYEDANDSDILKDDPILKRLVQKIRQAWPGVAILLRGDSYFSAPAVYEFCDKHDIKYVFGFKPYKPLMRASGNLMTQARELYEHSHKPVKIYGQKSL